MMLCSGNLIVDNDDLWNAIDGDSRLDRLRNNLNKG